MAAPRSWVVIPAAGVGRRMGADRPKQYLPLLGHTVLEWTVARMQAVPGVEGIVLALATDDPWWPELPLAGTPGLDVAPGGAERCHSVLNALEALQGRAREEDTVLVHDAARPCVRPEDVVRLLQAVQGDEAGGLLGVPVRDSMKRAAGDRVDHAVEREGLWHALTPQAFPWGVLRRALAAALAAGEQPTDEAAAVARTGLRPRLVEGHADNLKITRPEDLALAEFYLRRQEQP